MTFSYDTRCRKEGIIQNKYIIQHIYTCDLNGRLPGKIVCPPTLSCPRIATILNLYGWSFNAQHINMGLYPFNFPMYGVVYL